MSKYRHHLPQISPELFITDGGLETTLVFEQGYDLPEFAAFDLFKYTDGHEILRNYFLSYAEVARSNETGFILESPTWRASRDWGAKIGYSVKDLREINQISIAMLQDIRRQYETEKTRMVVSGCIGPRGDGYAVENKMTVQEAKVYHLEQIRTLSSTDADLVSAFTINYTEEAAGITLAAQEAGMPAVISFTVETDGRLPSGESLGEAVTAVDIATGKGPAYYMINCAHPSHFRDALNNGAPWLKRIRAIRANASEKSHAELDESVELDTGSPVDLGRRYAELRDSFRHFNIFGGCCGTDHRHVEAICRAVTSQN